MKKQKKGLYLAFALLGCSGLLATADFHRIVIDGDFSDWDAVPILATDVADNVGSIDFSTLQVANDADFIFIRYTLHVAINPNGTGGGTVIAIDEDNNIATGYNVFGQGLIGSEAAWQNDYPYEQATAVFNTEGGLSGSAYVAAPFAERAISVEISISRAVAHTGSGAAVFPADGESIGVMLWNQEGVGDAIKGVHVLSPKVLRPEKLGKKKGVDWGHSLSFHVR